MSLRIRLLAVVLFLLAIGGLIVGLSIAHSSDSMQLQHAPQTGITP